MSFTEHGTCKHCGREFRLRKDGRVWHHRRPVQTGSGLSKVCPGATDHPAAVARAVLGQDGDQQ